MVSPIVSFKSEFQKVLDGEDEDRENYRWINVENGDVTEVLVEAALVEQAFHMGSLTGTDAVKQLMQTVNDLHAHLINACNALEFVEYNAKMDHELRKHVRTVTEVIGTER